MSTLQEHPPNLDAQEYGWLRDDNSKSLVPVTVPSNIHAAPCDILKMIRCGCSTDKYCETGKCCCFKDQLACTVFCGCSTNELICLNPWTKFATPEEDDEDQ